MRSVPGAVLAGKYRLETRVAAGGMGSVWSAVDKQLDRRVAVKLIVESMSELGDVRARFLREAQAAARLRSPHVVQVLDFGVEEGTPFMVLEWLDGEDLGRMIKRQGRLSAAELAPLVKQLGKGLRAAHDAGLVHRDIKPANLFVARVDGEDVLKILDFGIAKAASVASSSGDQTKTGVVVGSLRFMSPEQARGLKMVDHRSDLWSVGVVLFNAMTGILPFQGETDADLLVKLCTETPRSPSSIDPALAPFDPFFRRCFVREMAERFQSVDELVAGFFQAAGLEVPAPARSRPSLAEPAAALAPADDTSGARSGVTGDPPHATLHGSAVSLLPPSPFKRWAIVGAVLAAAAGTIALVASSSDDEPTAAATPTAGAPAQGSAQPPSEPAAPLSGVALVTPAPSSSASAAPSASAPAVGRPSPARSPGSGGTKRPSIPENPY